MSFNDIVNTNNYNNYNKHNNIIVDNQVCKDSKELDCGFVTEKNKPTHILSIPINKKKEQSGKDDLVNITIKSCKNITSKQALLIIPITTYFSNKKSASLEKRGIIKWENSNIDNKDEGDLYYASFYSELKTNETNLLPGFALDGTDSTKGQNGEMLIKNMMYATQLVELGSTLLCDKDNVPIFIDEIPDTTYTKPETEINVFYSVTCDGISNVLTDRVAMACEISKDIRDMSESDPSAILSTDFVDDLNIVVPNSNGPQAAFDVDGPDLIEPDELKIREYLCQNFYTWTDSSDYNTGLTPLTKLKSYKFCETTDTSDSSNDKNYCWNKGDVSVKNDKCGNNWIQHGFKQNPFYFYFGPKKSAINKLKDKYLGQCLISDRSSIYKEQIRNLKNTNG